jgi:integrase
VPRVSFAPLVVKNLPAPARGPNGEVRQEDYWDDSTPGFGLRISSTGARTWILVTRVLKGGEWRQARIKIGPAPTKDDPNGLSLADARSKAGEFKKVAQGGDNPRQRAVAAVVKKVEDSRNTFGAVADDFLSRHVTKRRPNTIDQYTRVLQGADLAAWKARPLASLTRKDVRAVLQAIAERGAPTLANRTLAIVRSLFGWAIQEDIVAAAPTDHVKPPGAETKRERHLFGDVDRGRPCELGLAWHAFGECGLFAPALKMLLLTGQRVSEVEGLRRSELIDLEGTAPRWLLPADRAKNGREHLVPLGPLAVQVIKSATVFDKCDYVFSTNGKTNLLLGSKVKAAVDSAARKLRDENPGRFDGQLMSRWVFHDLRRTFKTGLAELGVRKEVRDALTNHKTGGIEETYNRARYEGDKREAMLLWEQHTEEIFREATEQKSVAAATRGNAVNAVERA